MQKIISDTSKFEEVKEDPILKRDASDKLKQKKLF